MNETTYLQSDVEGRMPTGPDGPVDLLRGQGLHSQGLQSPGPVAPEDVKGFTRSQLREGGPQQVQEVWLL